MAQQEQTGESTTGADDRAARLAELVTELTGTERAAALHAIRSGETGRRDALAVVATAMVSLDQPPPEGFRVTGFLRTPGVADAVVTTDEAVGRATVAPDPDR